MQNYLLENVENRGRKSVARYALPLLAYEEVFVILRCVGKAYLVVEFKALFVLLPFTYFDADAPTGIDGVRGAICTEVIENSRVMFGNVNCRDVQKQPYIIIWKRRMVDEVKETARANGVPEAEIEQIRGDDDDNASRMDGYANDKVTVLLKLYKNKETGTVWGVETCRNVLIRKPYDLEISAMYILPRSSMHS